MRTCTSYTEAVDILAELDFVSHRINHVLEMVDPVAYKAYKSARAALCKKYPWFRAVAAVDPTVFHGHSAIYNGATPKHYDGFDVHEGWSALLAMGQFTGGELCVENVGVVMNFAPGTLILLCGSALPHEVCQFAGGQRFSLAHFAHADVMRELGISFTVR